MIVNKTTKEQVEQWDSVLDEYESHLGMGSYSKIVGFDEEELNKYFTMSRDTIEKQTPEDCAQIAYRLGQYAFFIQRTVNREIARHNWAEETIKETIANEINNDKATSLNKIKKYTKQRIDRLSYLSNNIKNLSDILLSIQKTKVKHGTG